MDISTAYKQHQLILNIQHQIDEVKREIKQVDFAYKVAFIGTFALYFCFIWGMYVADLWGFTTWLTRNISEFAALLIYGVLAIALPLTMALIKEIAYRHFSNYPNSKMMMVLIVGILALAGVIYESITSSSQQQHMSFNSAENSKTFDAISNSVSTVETGSIASLIGGAEVKLAKCRKMVERGAWSDCAESEARLNAYLQSEQRGADSAERASVAALEAKTKAIADLKEENHKPVFKAIRDSFGVSINTGIMTVTIFVSAVFEVSHLLLIMLLAQKKQRLAGLEAALINNESDYMRSTGKTFKPEDFSDDSVLDMNEVREKSPSPIGFGVPATGFKYQEVKKQPAGFVQTDHLPTQPKAGNQGVNTRAETRPVQSEQPVAKVDNPKLGTAEIQLDWTQGKTTATPAPKYESYLDKALTTGRANTPEEVQQFIRGAGCKLTPTNTPETQADSSVSAGSVSECKLTPTAQEQADALYPVWLEKVQGGEMTPTHRPGWKFINSHLCGGKKSLTLTPAEITAILESWQQKATGSVIQLNKKQGRGYPKYILI